MSGPGPSRYLTLGMRYCKYCGNYKKNVNCIETGFGRISCPDCGYRIRTRRHSKAYLIEHMVKRY